MIFDSAIDLGYLVCEKAEGKTSAGKYVGLGPVDPAPPPEPQEEDWEEDE